MIATADRNASGFEREEFERYDKAESKNHYQARLLTLVEQIQLMQSAVKIHEDFVFCYDLVPLSAESSFSVKHLDIEPKDNEIAQKSYLKLWE
ncbi:MAG: hypothetical protein SOX56_06925 [[Pasteurella] mairii]|uniref:Uncharacterized protein n=1 Tax=[Pasteurella] mairii TaxID=757 RepID=A0A379B6G6_9PAST|nr:hypothetical protein [[Pasteurella] mairii]SUB34062.1 Uncharacterised protein [[Pasteurella] mairii]